MWNVGVLFLLRCMFFAAPQPTPFFLSLRQLAELALAVHAARVLPDGVWSQSIRIFEDLAAKGAWLCSYPSFSTSGTSLLQQYAELADQNLQPTAASADLGTPNIARHHSVQIAPGTSEMISLMDEFEQLFESTAVCATIGIEVLNDDSEIHDALTEATEEALGLTALRHPVSSMVAETDSRFRDRDFIATDFELSTRAEENPFISEENPSISQRGLESESGEVAEELRYLELLEQHAEEILVSGLVKRNRKRRTAPAPAVVQQSMVLFDEVGSLNAPWGAVEAIAVTRDNARKRKPKRPRKSSKSHQSSMQTGLLALEELEAQTRDLLDHS